MARESSALRSLTPPSASPRPWFGWLVRRSSRVSGSQPALLVLLFAASGYFLVPLIWLMISATKDNGDLFGSFGLWFGQRNSLFDNLTQLFTYEDGIFWHWLLNSLLYAGVGALCSTMLAALAGYAFAKFQFPGRSVGFSIVLGAILVPVTALALPLYLLLSQWGLVNSIWAVLLPSCVSPFGVYLARIYASASIPNELIEAARIDGAGEWRIFGTLALRLLSPALVTIFLFQFVAVWNNFFLPLVMLSDQHLYPVTLGLQTWNQSPALNNHALYNLVVTGSLVSILPLVASFVVLQRYWRNGLSLGSVAN